MNRFLQILCAVIGLTVSGQLVCSGQTRQPEYPYGLLQHILRDGTSLTMTYYPIEQFQYYVDQVLIYKKKPDIKTGKTTNKVRITLVSAEQTDRLLEAVQKDRHHIIFFSPDDSATCTVYQLDPKHFSARKFKISSIEIPEH